MLMLLLLEQHNKKVLTYTRTPRSFPIRLQMHFFIHFFFSVVRNRFGRFFLRHETTKKTFICNLSADWIGNRLYGTRLIIIIIFNYTRSSFVCDETLKSFSLHSVGEILNKKKVCLYNFNYVITKIREGWFSHIFRELQLIGSSFFSLLSCVHIMTIKDY